MTDFSNIGTVADLADVFDAAIRDADLGLQYEDWLRVKERFVPMVERLRELAAAPAAGTSAYEMVAAIETQNVEVTETLIHMTAATVLAKLIDEEGGGRCNVSFSPADMDSMHQRYIMHSTREGLVTTVKIEPRPDAFTDPPTSFYAEQGADADEPAKPQAAEHVFDRPLWAARIDGKLFPSSDHAQAQALVGRADVGQIAQVENRFCYHPECPAEHCNRTVNQTALVSDGDTTEPDSREVTSGVDSPDA